MGTEAGIKDIADITALVIRFTLRKHIGSGMIEGTLYFLELASSELAF
jgi:hypothetical protein